MILPEIEDAVQLSPPSPRGAIELLVPRPQEVAATGSAFAFHDDASPPVIAVIAEDAEAAAAPPTAPQAALCRELARHGRPPVVGFDDDGTASIRLIVKPRPGTPDRGAPERARPDESYRLTVGRRGITIAAPGAAGLFYGAATLAQWIRIHRRQVRRGRLPGLEVRDWPDFEHRGVMLDISRNKVPTLATLRRLVDLFAGLKINQLQLYMEHTFAYRGHRQVWRRASPLRPHEVRDLDAYCRARYIELVPNQNSFGHFHRWLTHQPYRHLAECPEGIDHPFSRHVEPFSLCPLDPGSLELVGELYDQLLPNFSSRMFNVGLDETFDLGRGRSAEACAAEGPERVYLRYLEWVHRMVAERGRRMLFWGDVILNRPQLIAELPGDAVALEWGYEADHPFAEDCRRFAESGLEFWVCPGTSSWNSFAGRTHNALHNLANAAIHGRAQGARGYLITDWGDNGHLQPLTASLPGFVAGAAFAWNAAAARDVGDLPLARLLDLHVFGGRGAGAAAVGLGDAYRLCGAERRNGTALFYLPIHAYKPAAERRFQGMTAAHLERTREHIDRAAAGVSGRSIASRELAWTADMLRFSCRLGRAWLAAGIDRPLGELGAPPGRELAREVGGLVEGLREVWRLRNRPGGLDDSASRLLEVRELLGE